MEKLPGDYIAGFVDGEGCFALKFVRSVRHDRPNKPVYFYWALEFVIMLKADDKEILDRIQYTLDCGTVRIPDGSGSVRYSVGGFNDLSTKIVPFFEKYSLHAKKKKDYLLWAEAVAILVRNKQTKAFRKMEMSEEDINKLKEIHGAMREIKGNQKNEWKWLNSTV